MKKNFDLTQKDFDALLDWLSADREAAGRRYEEIREGLTRFFRFRGCDEADALADEAINRVAVRISRFDSSKIVRTNAFFYGVAAKVYMEHLTKRKSLESAITENFSPAGKTKFFFDPHETEYGCLEKCLAKLSAEDSRLVVGYYSERAGGQFALRKTMAEALNIKPNALYARIYRIKATLKNCIENCLNGK